MRGRAKQGTTNAQKEDVLTGGQETGRLAGQSQSIAHRLAESVKVCAAGKSGTIEVEKSEE